MLACYLTWHLRKARAPLTFTDETRPEQANPVAPASRSARAQVKASRQALPDRPLPQLPQADRASGQTRNQVRFVDASATVPMLAEPTSAQREAFDLIGARSPSPWSTEMRLTYRPVGLSR